MLKIILVGYMAVGKTTIGNLVSIKTNFKAIDLDDLIEKKLKMDISDVFSQKGELYFRKVESDTFKEVLELNENLIISTGGGTPCYANSHLLLRGKNIKSFYLKASVDVIVERLKAEKKRRPIVSNRSDEEMQEFVAKHLFERSYFYNHANHIVSIDTKTPENIAGEIISLLD